MANTKKYRIRIIFGLSNINADFLQLILCMFVSHYLINNPLFGGALFLFTNIWTLYFQGGLRRIKFRQKGGLNLIMWILLAASVVAGLMLIFIYPAVKHILKANHVSLFVLIITARSIIAYRVNKTYSQKKRSNRLYKGLFQLLFLVPCSLFVVYFMDGVAVYTLIGGCALTGFLISFQESTLVSFSKYVKNSGKDKMGNIFAYQMFSNMTLYSQIAFSLGVLMYICYISFGVQQFSHYIYLLMTLWLAIMLISFEGFAWLAGKRGWILSINMFIIGVALWVIGSVRLYDVSDLWQGWFWTVFWGVGLSAVTAVTNRYNSDLKMVAKIAGRRVTDRELYFRNLLTQLVAVIISNAIMLCMITIWVFWIPMFSDVKVPLVFRRMMIQLPVIFMLISLFFALKQPLDERHRQKLVNYLGGVNKNKPTKESLNESLVKKSKVNVGIKIMATIIRPFLHLEVLGRENMDYANFPSIFVCNHGIIYGPVAAVIYLPTYFRPWVDKKMVFSDLCAEEIYRRQLKPLRFLPDRFKKWLAKFIARPVTWAINAFNPIPVGKNSVRGIMSIFEDTVKVLTEGDNVLIFPEKPRKVKKGKETTVKHETSTVGSLYTGFASIGKLYYEGTGKVLRFYPLYANKKGHTFKIGEPTIFDPQNDPREEKRRIAEELHGKMLVLKGE